MLHLHITMVTSCYIFTSPWWPHVTSSHHHGDLMLPPHITTVTSCYLLTSPRWPHVTSSHHHGDLMLHPHITMVTSCYLQVTMVTSACHQNHHSDSFILTHVTCYGGIRHNSNPPPNTHLALWLYTHVFSNHHTDLETFAVYQKLWNT